MNLCHTLNCRILTSKLYSNFLGWGASHISSEVLLFFRATDVLMAKKSDLGFLEVGLLDSKYHHPRPFMKSGTISM